MTNLSEHHEYLLLGKITDTLSREEALEVAMLLNENPEAQRGFDELIRQLPPEQVATSFEHLNKTGYWKDLTMLFKRQQPFLRRTLFVKKMAAAAVIITIVAVGWLSRRNEPGKNEQQTASVHYPPAVQLQLANGKVIDLSAEKGNIHANEANLNNSNKTLTYSVTGAEGDGMNSITVPTGMDYRVNLSDGTQIWLNAATKVDFPFAFKGNTREITINGEAYLQIAKDPQRPFVVHLPESTVQVMGTEFNVNTYDSGIVTVALVQGSVTMKSPVGEIHLLPGKEGIYKEEEGLLQQPFDPKYVLGWQKGLFYFDEATLPEISKVVRRWFGMQVVIDNSAINDKRFVGVLDRNQPIAVFQDDLKAISGIDSYIDANKVLHFK